mgnify:CR=1 FL=1
MQIIDPALEESHYWGDIGPDLRAIDIWIGSPGDLGRMFADSGGRIKQAGRRLLARHRDIFRDKTGRHLCHRTDRRACG